MKIEDQVVSLELAKKLKEAGYPQDSYYIWAYDLIGIIHRLLLRKDVKNHPQDYPAPTVAELSEKLSDNTRLHRENGEWFCYTDTSPSITYEKQADALAVMWLYLKDRSLLC